MPFKVMLNRVRAAKFRTGVVAGMALVAATVVIINKTTFPDWIVAPLLVADRKGPVDAVVVLGAGVIGDCVPNINSLRRVLLAVREWKRQPSSFLIISGGTGSTCRVAEAMARIARELGVPDARLRLEIASHSTHENAELSAALLKAWGHSRTLLVTDRLHMRRASSAFTAAGVQPFSSSVPIFEGHEDNLSMLSAGLREYAALGYYWLRGWAGGVRSAEETSGEMKSTIRKPSLTHDGPIVLLGASYAASWPLKEVAGFPVINKGVAGQQSFELVERFDADVLPARPRAVVLWGFINDIFRSTPDRMDATIARVQNSYLEMIRRARANGIEPIIATEVTARPQSATMRDRATVWVADLMRKTAYQDQINRHVLAVNDWLRETAAREQLAILELQSVLAEPGGRRRLAFAQDDGSHITPAGYDMLTTYARPVLEELLVAR